MSWTMTKSILTKYRANSCKDVWAHDQMSEFELTYGKYLYVPLCIPKIIINDIEKFKSFHNKYGYLAKRNQTKSYEELSYFGQDDYDQKIIEASYTKIVKQTAPEIFEQVIEYMPFLSTSMTDFSDWTMWSTRNYVPNHRDQTPMVDGPLMIRVMLYDDNPQQTLKMTLDPIDRTVDYKFYPDIPADTNTFTWNNLRLLHDSVYNTGHSKILWLFNLRLSPYYLDSSRLNKYIDLLDRSIAKYKEQTAVDTLTTFKDYLEIEK